MTEERNAINITVSGLPGSGKSRITYLLKEFLKDRGLNVEMTDNADFDSEEQFDEFMSKNIEGMVANFSKTKTVKIKSVSTNRNFNNKS
jgi:nucleoside-triphosphatase THEP1